MTAALIQPELLPLCSWAEMLPIGITDVAVVAPHPDDETLGCGGAIAALSQQGLTVKVLVVSDGTQSHPNSQKFSAVALQTLREQETLAAMKILGLSPQDVVFLRLPDGAVPGEGHPNFKTATERCCEVLVDWSPQVIFAPWRADPHPDHRATSQLVRAAMPTLSTVKLLEYPVWDWDESQRGDCPTATHQGWRLDIGSTVALKRQAIGAYRSQITDLIDDDPTGFQLTPEMLSYFNRPWELFFEERP